MLLEFDFNSNNENMYVNTITAVLRTGEKVVFDREETDWTYDAVRGIGECMWKGVYIWDGEKENYDIPMDIFAKISTLTVDIEDDAPEDYYFRIENVNIIHNDETKSLLSIIMDTEDKEFDAAGYAYEESTKELLNAYVDFKCEEESPKQVLIDLVALGGTPEQLMAMGFEKPDIAIAVDVNLYP